jgi:two-component system, LytTR family, sensor kinase
MNLINSLIFSNRLGIRIFRHLLFWTTDIVSYLIVSSASTEVNSVLVYGILLKIPLVAGVAYFIMYYLIPEFAQRRNNGTLLLWILPILLFLGVGLRYYRHYVVNPLIDSPDAAAYVIWDFSRIVGEIFSAMVVISMAVAIKLIKNKTELQQSNDQLVAEKKVAELNFLKAQMQPHFLFNTLNTLYSETIQESGKAQQVVLYLSGLLRFILDECNKPSIPLSHEIRVVKDFIALEQLRHGSRLTVALNVLDINPKTMISPLIFLPFVENSFKHTLNTIRGKIYIAILITMKDDNLVMEIENDKGDPGKHVNGHEPGKGIANVRKQLELLYGKDFTLDLDDSPTRYKVSLVIPVKRMEEYA